MHPSPSCLPKMDPFSRRRKQRTAIWIYIPYGDGYVVPVFDTEA